MKRAVPVLALCLPPLVLLGRTLGPHRAPGYPTEMLFAQLFSGTQVARWPAGWWPGNLVAALWQAGLGGLFDPGLAYGLLLLVALIGAGVGPWLLARRAGAGPWVAFLGALAVQLSPPTLRAVASGELGVLGVGPAALALSGWGGPWLAALTALTAGAWSLPAGLAVALWGLSRRRWGLLLAVAPLLFVGSPSALPGAARQAIPAQRTVASYVSDDLSAFPLPPAEQPPAMETGHQGGGGLQVLSRLPGGVGAWLVLSLALIWGGRRWGLAGLALGVGWVLVFGWLPARGSPPAIPPDWLVALGPWVPGLRPPVGALAWLAPMLLCVAPAAARVRPRAAVLLALGLAAWLENPRFSLPVVATSDQPAFSVLDGLPPGPVVVFPSPAPPWFQGRRSTAELLFLASRFGRGLSIGAGADAALMGVLSREADLPVDLSAGPLLWGLEGDAFQAARDGGFQALLLDRGALDEDAAARIDALLAEQVGRPVTESDGWSVYDLRPLAAR